MKLVEDFLSIQGEGKYQGRLAIFLRFFGCNFNCSGFNVNQKSPKNGEILKGCDTIRAVFTSHFEAQKINSEQELLNLIYKKSEKLNQKPIIILTGGEPLLNYEDKIFLKFIEKLIMDNFEVHFETNASINIDFNKYPIYKQCSFALGIKLQNSGEKKEKRINKNAIKNICLNAKDSFYKFVLLGNDDEILEIREILDIYENEIWCMAMGHNKYELEKNAENVVNFAIKHGFNYSDRIHIRIWNDEEKK